MLSFYATSISNLSRKSNYFFPSRSVLVEIAGPNPDIIRLKQLLPSSFSIPQVIYPVKKKVVPAAKKNMQDTGNFRLNVLSYWNSKLATVAKRSKCNFSK